MHFEFESHLGIGMGEQASSVINSEPNMLWPYGTYPKSATDTLIPPMNYTLNSAGLITLIFVVKAKVINVK